MNKIIKVITCFIILLTITTGCTKTSKYNYDSPSGEKIIVSFKNKYNLDITESNPFEIKNGDDLIATGTFITAYGYDYLYKSLDTDTLVEGKQEGTKDGNSYVFYRFAKTEYKYLIRIKDTDTAVTLTSKKSKDQIEELFKELSFSKEK
ncbi:MAG: hypothetical protein K5666_00365 [Bacilli bacterium]|nr:hypothetical protein [Bacilli bacterium]